MADQQYPPPYNKQADPSQPVPAHVPGQPGQPIAMQPVGPGAMDPSGQTQTVTPLNLLSERVEFIDCQMCHSRAKTRVVKSGEGLQFLTGAVLCLVCICLAPLPCCLHWFEETKWYCTNCGQQVAQKTHESPVQVIPPAQALHAPSAYANPQQAPPPAGVVPPQPGPQSPPPAMTVQQPEIAYAPAPAPAQAPHTEKS